MQPRQTALEPTRLAKGQSFHFHARTGTRIVVMHGRIGVVERSMLLCERIVEQACVLRDGEQYQVLQRGWIALQAYEPAEFLCLEPKARGSVVGALRGWLSGMAQSVGMGIPFCPVDPIALGSKACIALFKGLKRTRAFMLK